jgi:serine protease AprX
MKRHVLATTALVLVCCAYSAAHLVRAQSAGETIGLNRITATHLPAEFIRGVATFDAVPTAADVANLASAGLAVQPMRHVPLAIVAGPVSAMQSVVSAGYAQDVYPDEAIQLFDTKSADAMGTASLRAAGITGRGVTAAVVDSGCDATHPDLSDHVAHNVKLYSGEYANIRPDGTSTIVVPYEMGPYQNSDIGGGHGTHVAGIIAADSTSDPLGGRYGVAPDAELVCYSIGEVLFTTAVVTAYDHLLDQPNLWNVRVINNSWGNSFRPFDPRDPVAVITRAVADLGVTVVFAAGNSGYSVAEMSLNPFSQAPWVISVAADNLARVRANFSSTGLMFDNSQPVTIGAGGHNVFIGNRLGVYHPDVTAPGQSISSSCTPLGVAVRCSTNLTTATASGTSMASPHVAGAAAVLLQANPNLTPEQVRMALQATAVPVTTSADDPNGSTTAPFWQAGYGHVDLAAAVNLVTSKLNWAHRLSQAQASADARVLGSIGYSVPRSDVWSYDAPRVSAGGSDHRVYAAPVDSSVTHLKITLSHPSGAVAGENGMTYTVTVRDAAGQVLGTTTEAATGAGTASAFITLSGAPVSFGEFTFEVNGVLAVSDPDTLDSESLLGRIVTLQVAQLRK